MFRTLLPAPIVCGKVNYLNQVSYLFFQYSFFEGCDVMDLSVSIY